MGYISRINRIISRVSNTLFRKSESVREVCLRELDVSDFKISLTSKIEQQADGSRCCVPDRIKFSGKLQQRCRCQDSTRPQSSDTNPGISYGADIDGWSQRAGGDRACPTFIFDSYNTMTGMTGLDIPCQVCGELGEVDEDEDCRAQSGPPVSFSHDIPFSELFNNNIADARSADTIPVEAEPSSKIKGYGCECTGQIIERLEFNYTTQEYEKNRYCIPDMNTLLCMMKEAQCESRTYDRDVMGSIPMHCIQYAACAAKDALDQRAGAKCKCSFNCR